MRWLRIGIVAAFLLAAVAAGIAGSAAREDAAEVESDPPDLSATAEIRRSFMAPGVVAVAVTNHGDADVRVIGLEFISDSFAPLGVQEFDANIPPSVNPRDLMTDYGAAQCPDGIDSVAAPSSAVLDVVTADGAVHEVVAELPHPNEVLNRLLYEACAAELIDSSVDLELGELTRAADGTLEGALTLTPRQGVDAIVTEIRGSVLFAIEFADPSGESIPLRFDADRCEGHAVGDAKQPFGFNVWIAVDGAAPVPTPIPVAEAHEQALYSMLDERCGHSPD